MIKPVKNTKRTLRFPIVFEPRHTLLLKASIQTVKTKQSYLGLKYVLAITRMYCEEIIYKTSDAEKCCQKCALLMYIVINHDFVLLTYLMN